MKVEGIGEIAPPRIKLKIPSLYGLLLQDEAKRRTDRDNLRKDPWGKGMRKNAHHIGLVAQAVACQYLDVPLDLTHVHDGGVDFTIAGVDVDFKATESEETPAIREIELKPGMVFLLGKIRGNEIDLLGWCTSAAMWEHGEKVTMPSGPNNRQIADIFLQDSRLMLEKSRRRNVLRYPGGKTSLMNKLASYAPIPNLFGGGFETYVELFVGGGAMFFELSRRGKHWKRTVLNDVDSSLMAIYQAARDYPSKLKKQVMKVEPSVELWERAKEIDGIDTGDVVKRAVAKLVLHYCSHGGLGYMAGGAQGGKEQKSKYPVGCRWNPFAICRTIDFLEKSLTDEDVLCQASFEQVSYPDDESTFVFADPPYVQAGPQLYRHSFDESDHRRLAEVFHASRAKWLLTYDDCPLTRELYGDHIAESYPMTSGNNHARKHGELVIVK